MNEEQQRIKIAEACDLFRIMPLRRTTRKGKPDPNGVRLWYCEEHHGGAATYAEVPNYPNDLNAMHEAEISYIITNGLWDDYVGHLKAIMYQGERFWGQATAKQRAEAFLKTLNLWEETRP